MSPSPVSKPDGLADDVAAAFVPKSEDIGVTFPSFNTSPSEGLPSSSSLISDVSSSFVPASNSTMPPSSVSSLSQLDMEVIDSITPGDPSDMFLSDFSAPQQQMQLLSAASDDMQGVVPFREESPGSANTPSTNPSIAASPVPPQFSNVSTSSLASALDDPGAALLNRSRSGSLASPSAAGFAPQMSPPRHANGTSFSFSVPSDYAGIPRPDPVNAPHMLVVDDVLIGIMRAAASARQACSMGQGVEATSKIDEMKKQIALVSDLMAATILDTSSQGLNSQTLMSGIQSQPGAQGHRHSLSMPGLTQSVAPGNIPNFPGVGIVSLNTVSPSLEQTVSGHMSVDMPAVQGSPDSDTSRKRCASSMAGNRVNKAIRLDSSDGGFPLLTQPTTPPTGLNMTSIHGQTLSASHPPSLITPPAAPLSGGVPVSSSNTSAGPLSASLAPMPSLSQNGASPPSIPPSRPQSPPGGLASSQTHGWTTGKKRMSASAPITHAALTQAQPVFSLGITSSAPMSNADPTGEVEMTSPNTRSPWADVSSVAMTAPLGSGIGSVRPQDIDVTAYDAPPYPPPGHSSLTSGHIVPGISAATASRASRSSSFSSSLTDQMSMANAHAMAMYNNAAPDRGPVPGQVPVSAPVQHHSPPDFVPSQGGRARARSRASLPAPRSPSTSSCEDDGDSDYEGAYGRGRGYSLPKSSPPLKSRDSSNERSSALSRHGGGSPGEGQGPNSGHGNDIPAEYRAEVDRVFFEFLTKICSNLDATDAKGELIHQTLMAKKMQRLDESPDFRPFKFRIQAFTNGFLEELAKQGYSEEKIAMKKVRNYLWTQPYISRFNEDGKKAKSKGNHIWNIDAKKRSEGGWDFRPFHRKLAGSPPSVAYIGLRWSWVPRIWDPQASRANIQVQYSSPNLPPWLSWRDGILQGTPPPDAQSCEVTVEARTSQDGREELLSQSFLINVSLVPTGTDMSFSGTRPSLTTDLHNPRRVNSDSIVPVASARPLQPPPQPMTQTSALTTQDAQMMQVLTSAAQRVAQEAQAHVIAAHNPNEPPGLELRALAKQQHVLTVTAQALDQEVSAPPDSVSPSSHALVAAAQQVVFQAARQVAADRTAVMSLATGIPAPQAPSGGAVTVNEVSVATQTAVAQAVEITGPLSSEVDVMMTASSLLQQQTRPSLMATSAAIEAASLNSALDASRPHSTGAIPPQFSAVLPNAVPSFPTTMPLPNMGSIGF